MGWGAWGRGVECRVLEVEQFGFDVEEFGIEAPGGEGFGDGAELFVGVAMVVGDDGCCDDGSGGILEAVDFGDCGVEAVTEAFDDGADDGALFFEGAGGKAETESDDAEDHGVSLGSARARGSWGLSGGGFR